MSRIAILTRPEGRNEVLSRNLSRAGWQVLALPALALMPLSVAAPDLPLPHHYDMVVFVSGYAVRAYVKQLREITGLARWPASVPVATVGPASATAVHELSDFCMDTTVVCPPPDARTHDSEALWAVLCDRERLPGRVLIVRGTQGRDWLTEQFESSGSQVHRYAAYHRQPAAWSSRAIEQLKQWGLRGQKVTWLLTSGEGVSSAFAHVRAAGLEDWWQVCSFVVTHASLATRLTQEDGGAVPDAMVKICLPADDAILAAFVAA